MSETSPFALFLHFAVLSLLAFGGIGSLLPEIHRYVVEVNGWLTSRQFADVYAIGQASPGPNMMYLALVGWLVSGWAGALAVTVGLVVPPALLTLGLVRLESSNPDSRLSRVVRRGIAPITIGLVLASGLTLVQAVDHDWRSYLVTTLTVVVVLATRINPLWLIAAGAVLGIAEIV